MKTDIEKVNAWLNWCETLRLNNSGIKNNFVVLQQAAMRGLQIVQPTDKENRSKFFFYAGIGNYYQAKFDSAQAYFYKSLREAQSANLARQVSKACVVLIPVNYQLQQQAKVDECKNILQGIIDTTNNKDILEDGYYALGSYYQQKSYYTTAQDYFIRSLELRQKSVDTTRDAKKKFDYAIQCDMLSKLYLNTQMVDKSIATLREGERFASVSPNVSNRLLSSYVEAYATIGNIDSSLYYNNRLNEQAAKDPIFPSEIATSDLNIALYYIRQKQFSRASSFLDKADTVAAHIGSPLLIFQVQMIKGRWLEETGKYDGAIAILSEAIPVAKQLNRELYANTLQYMALAQKGKRNTELALQYYEKYAEQTDTLAKEKLSNNFADQETHYEVSRKEQQIVLLDRENRLNLFELQGASRTRLILVAGLILLGISSLLLWLFYRNKEKVNKILNVQNAELEKLNTRLSIANETKAKLFSIIGHDLRAPASQIVQLLQLQKQSPGMLSESSAQQHDDKLKKVSENVLETMEDLLLWSKSQMQQFTPELFPVDIALLLAKELDLIQSMLEQRELRITNLVTGPIIVNTDENFVSIILRNLLQNAVKHSDNDSSIEVRAADQKILIYNQSSGVDFDNLHASSLKKKIDSKSSGLGLQIAHDLAISIQASIEFERVEESKILTILTL
ncbi:ATP-binding protein [Mucilaginibacter sp.]|uniref:sensor histidine kinase n=1 Tax=Mucilaginibacter sp. TaxID=1882438 RepID=UPI0035BC0111